MTENRRGRRPNRRGKQSERSQPQPRAGPLPFRLLVVDDDPNLGESLRDVLTDKGYEVVVVMQGAVALDRLAREHFDMALVDIRMPGLDGAATAKLIHTLKPGLPVAMITGYELDDLAREALREGAVAILSKPLDIDRTVDLIEHTIKRPTVLVIDPDRLDVEELRQALESADCLTTVAPDLSQAREVLGRAAYDCIILNAALVRRHGPDALVDIARLQPGAYLVFVRPAAPAEPAADSKRSETPPTAAQRTLEAQVRHAAFAVLDRSASPQDVLRVVQRIKELIKEKSDDQ